MLNLSISIFIPCHFRDGVGSVGTSKWIFPQERINPFPMEGEKSTKNENAVGAELNNTDAPHDVSLPLLAKWSPLEYTHIIPCIKNLT